MEGPGCRAARPSRSVPRTLIVMQPPYPLSQTLEIHVGEQGGVKAALAAAGLGESPLRQPIGELLEGAAHLSVTPSEMRLDRTETDPAPLLGRVQRMAQL